MRTYGLGSCAEYMMKGGIVGRTVLITKVIEYIKMKNYWGNERELEKYLRINAGDSYRRNLQNHALDDR